VNLLLSDPAFLSVAAGGAALWTPAEITTALWLDAADASTITESGGVVSQWDDKSGNSRHAVQSNASLRPSLISAVQNNNSAIRFDGVDDRLLVISSFLQATNNFSLSWVFTRRGAGTGDDYRPSVSVYSSASNDYGAYHYVRNSNNLGASYPNTTASPSWSNYNLSSGTQYANGTFEIMQFKAAVTRWDVFRNTIAEGGYNPGTALSVTYPHNGLVLGGQNTPSRNSNIDICEVVVVLGSMTTLDNQKLEGYLAHKWGLTANLPAGHPYKSAAPTA
jgi:hypothetical protein